MPSRNFQVSNFWGDHGVDCGHPRMMKPALTDAFLFLEHSEVLRKKLQQRVAVLRDRSHALGSSSAHGGRRPSLEDEMADFFRHPRRTSAILGG